MHNNNITARPKPNGRRSVLALAAPLTLFVLPLSASAAEVTPFNAPSLHPLTQIFAIPSPPAPTSLQPGNISFALQQELANIYAVKQRGREQLLLDGEVWRSMLTLGWDLSESWQLSLVIPYIRHTGGELDSLINDWHEGFSMPTGGRENRPNNAFHYYYQHDGRVLLNLPEQTNGVGDLRLRATHAMNLDTRQLFLTLETKLPTGNPDKLTGSGALDISLSAMVRDSDSLSNWNLTLFGGGGLAWLGNTDLRLNEAQKNWLWATRAGAAWTPWTWLHIKAQLDHHTAVYNSNLRALGSQALQLTTGITWHITNNTALELAFSEDLMTTATPDITFLGGLRHQF